MMIKKILLMGAVIAASATVASATPIVGNISINGADTYTNTTITFMTPGTTVVSPTAVGNIGASNGTLSSIGVCTGCVALTSFNFDGGFVPVTVFTASNSGVTSSLMLNQVTSFLFDAAGGLTINGIGTLSETGFDTTSGNLILTSQGGGVGTRGNVTFSATSTATGVAPTPEPSSLLLLGTGLVSSAGALYRRRRRVIA